MAKRFRFPSWDTLIHIAITEVIVNAIWWGVGKLIVIQSPIRDWGFLVLSLATLIVVGWYLGKRLESRPSPLVKQPVASFYPNRTELIKTKGNLAGLLSGHERVWAIFHTGAISKVSGVLAKCRFERLILTDPRDEYMMNNLEPRGNNAEQHKELIRQVAEIASKNGSDVHYYAGPIGNSLIIADTIKLADDRFSEQAWAQIETGIPFLSPHDRPSFVIYNKDDGRDAFNAFLGHFNTMWARSSPTPMEDLTYGRST